jgi:hypothetical protein
MEVSNQVHSQFMFNNSLPVCNQQQHIINKWPEKHESKFCWSHVNIQMWEHFQYVNYIARHNGNGLTVYQYATATHGQLGNDMAHAVSHRRTLGLCLGQFTWDLWWHFSELFGLPLSVSFHHGSPCSYIIWGMNNRPVCGCSSET